MIKVRWSKSYYGHKTYLDRKPAHKRFIVVENQYSLIMLDKMEAEKLVKDLNKKIALMEVSLGKKIKEIRDSFPKPDTKLLPTRIPTPVEPTYVDPKGSCATCEYSALGMFDKPCDNCNSCSNSCNSVHNNWKRRG